MLSQEVVHLFQDLHVQRDVGDDTLKSRVLDLEFFESPRFVGIHAAVLIPPTMNHLLADAQCLDELRDSAARRKHRIGLTQFVHDLLR